MNYLEKFIETYAKAQLKDADETIRWAAEKMESYSDEIAAVIKGKTKKRYSIYHRHAGDYGKRAAPAG